MASNENQADRREGDDQDKHQEHHHGKREGAVKDVVKGDVRIVDRRLDSVTRKAEGRREQPDLGADHGDDSEPHQIPLQPLDRRQEQGDHNEDNGGGVQDRSQQHQEDDVKHNLVRIRFYASKMELRGFTHRNSLT